MAISSASVAFPAIPISASEEVDGTTDLQPTPPVILTTISQLQQIGVDELLEQAANVSAFSYFCWYCAETTASSVSRNFRGKQLTLSWTFLILPCLVLILQHFVTQYSVFHAVLHILKT
jgi:hypothetical protein